MLCPHSTLLFLVFFPRDPTTPPLHPTAKPSTPRYRDALIVVFASALHLLLVSIISSLLFFLSRPSLQPWAVFLGLCSGVLAILQYLPQIRTTYRLRDVKSLSIPMMCIQTPGSFVFAGSLIARLGKEGWSSWGVYVVTGFLQGSLLVMGLVFMWQRRRDGKAMDALRDENGDDGPEEGEEEAEPPPDERSALLHGTNR